MNKIEPHKFASLLYSRLDLATEIAKKLEDQRKAEASFAEALQKAVPKKLQRFVREQGVIDTLIRYGRFSDRYSYNIRGLQSYKSVEAGLEELRAAWKDNVIIMLDEPGERGRLSIRYYAAPHIF